MDKRYDQAFGVRVPVPGEKPDELVAFKMNEKRRAEIARSEELDEATHKARMARLEKETAVANSTVEKTEQPAPQPPGIKTTGEFNIGSFNLMEIMNQRDTERDALRIQAQEEAKTQAGITETLRQKLHTSEMASIKAGFEYQMETMTNMVAAYASKGSFMEEYNKTKELATQMGMVAPGGASSDMQTQLAIKKMDFEQTMEMRRYAREEKRADREFQRQLRKDEIETEYKRDEMKRQAKRDEMFSSAPEVIGRVIAQASADRAQDQASGVVETPPPSNGEKVYGITANPGESGEVRCPDCESSIGIGSTATTAICANPNCGARLNISRHGQKPAHVGTPGEDEEE